MTVCTSSMLPGFGVVTSASAFRGPKETLTPRFDRPLRLARDQDGSVFRAQPRFDALDQPLPQ